MNLHCVFYTPEGEADRQEFFASEGAASKRCTELKKIGGLLGKPEREAVDVPTNKTGLIEWLNENAGLAKAP